MSKSAKPKSDDDKGRAVFEKLSEEDKRALKHFLTGQIRNLLCNEFGLGGSRHAKDIMETKIRELGRKKFDEQLIKSMADAAIMGSVKQHRLDIRKLITEAAQKEAKRQIDKIIKDATQQITVSVNVRTPQPENEIKSDLMGRFA